MSMGYSHLMYDVLLVYVCANAGLYVNKHSKGKENNCLGSCCNCKSCVYSNNKAMQGRQLSGSCPTIVW